MCLSRCGVGKQGGKAYGDGGMRPTKGGNGIANRIGRDDAMLMVAGENGIGKRTPLDDYRKQKRGGKGIITMKTTDKTGLVVGALTVRDHDELMLITVGGQMVRIPVKGIREAGRNTQGVKLIDLAEKDHLQAVAPVISEGEDEETPGLPLPA